MKKKSDWRTRFIRLCAVVLPLVVLCFTACKDEDKEENLPFDPTKPVVITDFMLFNKKVPVGSIWRKLWERPQKIESDSWW